MPFTSFTEPALEILQAAVAEFAAAKTKEKNRIIKETEAKVREFHPNSSTHPLVTVQHKKVSMISLCKA